MGAWQGEKVAVRMLRGMSEESRADLSRQVAIMCRLHHPCIAATRGLVDDGKQHALVMKHYKRGSVAEFMSSPSYARTTPVQRLRMALHVATGMHGLHSMTPPILHGDLKISNLLMDSDGHVVVSDYGLVACTGLVPRVGEGAVISNSPPELLLDPNAPCTMLSDAYAFGVVLLEIMTGQPAFNGMNTPAILHLVSEGTRPRIPSDGVIVPELVATIIRACWAQQAEARPAFATIVQWVQAVVAQLEAAEQQEPLLSPCASVEPQQHF
jgi:serine/threonine protein kinase